MKLKNKILLISFLLLMFTLFLNTSNVFASFEFKYNNIKHTVPDIPEDSKYFFIAINSSNNYVLYTCDKPLKLVTNVFGYLSIGSSESGGIVNYYNGKSGAFNLVTSSEGIITFTDSETDTDHIIYSNHDVYYNGEIFFQSPVTEVAVIPALETAQEVPKAMVQTLRIMIPVGLIVLSIGLVIYLIKRVIYLSR